MSTRKVAVAGGNASDSEDQIETLGDAPSSPRTEASLGDASPSESDGKKKKKGRKWSLVRSAHNDGVETKKRRSLIRSVFTTKTMLEHKQASAEERARATLFELCFYIIFVIITCILAFGMTTPTHYYYTKGLENLFVHNKFVDSADVSNTYTSISSASQVWDWMDGSLIPGLFPTHYYNGEPLPTNPGKLLEDSELLGAPRIRQLKVTNDSCSVPAAFDDIIFDCYAAYAQSKEDRAQQIPATGQGIALNNATNDAWSYRSADELEHSNYEGQIDTYSGGGFAIDLPRNFSSAKAIVANLKNMRWVTEGSRVIFVDYAVYNANVNLFNIGKFIIELPATGGVVTTYRLLTLKFIRYVTTFDYFILACEFLFVCFIIKFTIDEVLEIRTLGWSYLTRPWDLLDMLILLISYTAFIFNVIRYFFIKDKLQATIDEPNTYANFDEFAYWQWTYNTMVAVCVFFIWIKIFKYLNFNRTMTLMSNTLSRCAGDILGYTVMFFIVFFAYAQFGYLVFGPTTFGFHTFPDSLYSLFRIILGDFDFYGLIRANRVVGPIFFVTYVFVVFFILVNVFLAIINDSYIDAKADMDDNPDEAHKEIADYLYSVFANIWATITFKKYRKRNKKDGAEGSDEGAAEAAGSKKATEQKNVQFPTDGNGDDGLADLDEEDDEVDENGEKLGRAMDKIKAANAISSAGRRKGSAMRRMSKDIMSINNDLKEQLSEEMNERMGLMEERIGSIAKNVDALLVAMENIQIRMSKSNARVSLDPVSSDDEDSNTEA
jgi:polycystin 2